MHPSVLSWAQFSMFEERVKANGGWGGGGEEKEFKLQKSNSLNPVFKIEEERKIKLFYSTLKIL